MSTSLSLFALRNVDPAFNVFGVHLWDWSPAQFQAFNPIWIFILSPVLAWVYTAAGKLGKDLSIAAKFALGFAIVAAGFFIYGVGRPFRRQQRPGVVVDHGLGLWRVFRWANCWSAASAWR